MPSHRTRPLKILRQSPPLVVTLISLTLLVLVIVLLTVLAVINPAVAERLIPLRTTGAPLALNPGDRLDTRITLPPTWTPTRTSPPPGTLTPSNTPTPTPTRTATPTRSPTLTFTPVHTAPAGWYEFLARDARIALQLTSTWTALVLTDLDARGALAEINQRDPALAASVRDGLGQAALDHLILIAFDTATGGDVYVVNLSIAYASSAEGATIDEVRDLHLTLYEGSDFYQVTGTDSPRVDSQPAHRIRYTTTFERGGDSTTVYHQEVISEQQRSTDPLLLITLSTSQERRNIYEALLDRIVSTIRFTR